MLWASAAIDRVDLSVPTKSGGLVNRVIKAAGTGKLK